MELIDRYLQAVRFWLPKTQADDIIAELSEDIRSQVSEEEQILGRPLNENEIEAILKKRGRPMIVASRYLPQRWLIGPAFFPIYWMILKISLATYLASWFLVWLGILIFDSTYGSHHGALTIVGEAWGSVWGGFFIAASSITLVFALLEQGQNTGGFLKYWSPRTLPPVRDPNRSLKLNSICEMVGGVVLFIWWLAAMRSPTAFDRAGVRIVFAPEWHFFFTALMVVILGGVVLAAVNLVRPYWTRGRALMKLGIDCASATIWCWFLKAHILAEIVAPNLSPARAAQIIDSINTNAAKAFPFAVIGCALAIGLSDIGRLIRLKPSVTRLAPKLAVIFMIALIAWVIS